MPGLTLPCGIVRRVLKPHFDAYFDAYFDAWIDALVWYSTLSVETLL